MRVFLIFIFFGTIFPAQAQNGYKVDNTISNFKAESILNFDSKKADFNSLKKEITIIDFFGTWCIPCLRALPHMDSLQKQFPNNVRIILVSVENEDVLQKFVGDHKARNFPLLVDEDNKISDLFKPPSYPYTVVINSANNILAITEASNINTDQISVWLKLKNNANNNVASMPEKDTTTFVEKETQIRVNKYNELSQQFIYAAKTGNDVSEQINELAKINFESLATTLSNDDLRKAFWIN
ncbi:MAG: TlpA disulfide reductase family protein, partial [Ginsengibacter sp.]